MSEQLMDVTQALLGIEVGDRVSLFIPVEDAPFYGTVVKTFANEVGYGIAKVQFDRPRLRWGTETSINGWWGMSDLRLVSKKEQQ
jgi:hypothetical protein